MHWNSRRILPRNERESFCESVDRSFRESQKSPGAQHSHEYRPQQKKLKTSAVKRYFSCLSRIDFLFQFCCSCGLEVSRFEIVREAVFFLSFTLRSDDSSAVKGSLFTAIINFPRSAARRFTTTTAGGTVNTIGKRRKEKCAQLKNR